MELITGENDNGRRLDRILRKALPDCPLPLIHRLLRQGRVTVNGKSAKAQDRPDSGAVIRIPSLKDKDAPKSAPAVRRLPPPEIIWQARGLLAVNKPAGIAVHGSNSLDEMVRSFLTEKLPPSLSFKPGPLHRLDKPSSGIVIFSTSIEGARLFTSLLKERKVRKTYLAIVEGEIKNEEIWEDELVRDREKKKTFVSPSNAAGKSAITKIKPLAVKDNFTLALAEIATGRTHQIRAQAASHGHPLSGDKKYGGRGAGGFFLHAWKLEFLEYVIEAPPPEAFREKMKEKFLHVNPNRLAD
ncbi:MAG: RluA family pseudouridine synthase [Treponema sp.]|jgi:23S rRNA pseudouridine955/2504/2580 synthase|nr:RluA family pseudouridine synthase [Treponema sp.]